MSGVGPRPNLAPWAGLPDWRTVPERIRWGPVRIPPITLGATLIFDFPTVATRAWVGVDMEGAASVTGVYRLSEVESGHTVLETTGLQHRWTIGSKSPQMSIALREVPLWGPLRRLYITAAEVQPNFGLVLQAMLSDIPTTALPSAVYQWSGTVAAPYTGPTNDPS